MLFLFGGNVGVAAGEAIHRPAAANGAGSRHRFGKKLNDYNKNRSCAILPQALFPGKTSPIFSSVSADRNLIHLQDTGPKMELVKAHHHP